MTSLSASALAARFYAARRDDGLVVLEGVHPLKHALRFGGDVEDVVVRADVEIEAIVGHVAPELVAEVQRRAVVMPASDFESLAPAAPPSGVISLARRPSVDSEALWNGGEGNGGDEKGSAAPVVVLETPSHLGNVGAVVRVAAAAAAGGVVVVGKQDPWHPTAVRGGAGLQFAVPCVRVEELPSRMGRPLVAVHPEGEPLGRGTDLGGTVLVFGSESRGLSEGMLARVERKVAIPMREGVSSLNLATAVAVVLYRSCE